MRPLPNQRVLRQRNTLLKPILISSTLITGVLSVWGFTQLSETQHRVNAGTKPTHATLLNQESFQSPKTQLGRPFQSTNGQRTTNSQQRYGTQVYSWIDDHGQKHYADFPHPSANKSTLVPNVVRFKPTASSREKTNDRKPGYKTPSTFQKAASTNNGKTSSCARLQKDLKYVRAKMRAGYKASESNRLRSKERELKKKIYKYCD